MASETSEESVCGINNQLESINDPRIKSFFSELETLGDITKSIYGKTIDRVNVGLSKVGARPVSGIRGLYFNKGMWKVKYFDNDYEVVTCLFRYDDTDKLIKTYHIARSFLNKVIEYNRHINEDDGTILDELTNDQLIELDKRKSKVTYEITSRPYLSDLCDKNDPLIIENLSLKRTRKTQPTNFVQKPYYRDNEVKRKKREAPEPTNNFDLQAIMASRNVGTGIKNRKLPKFEAKILKYSNFSTIDMIHDMIDKNCEAKLCDHGKIYSIKQKNCEFRSIDQSEKSSENTIGQAAVKHEMINGSKRENNCESQKSKERKTKSPNDEYMFIIKSYNFDNCFKK
uniref:Uncharacterized protein n=1 Tax=Theileria annulata TaxID=5874 RepID=A0A3B0MNR7_THEAN